jgi:hypothetical protein
MTAQATNWREGVLTLCPAVAPRLHIERARDCEGGLETSWCTDYCWGKCSPGGGGGGS